MTRGSPWWTKDNWKCQDNLSRRTLYPDQRYKSWETLRVSLAASRNSHIWQDKHCIETKHKFYRPQKKWRSKHLGASKGEQRLFLWHTQCEEERRASTACQVSMKYVPVSQYARSFWALFQELPLACMTLCQSPTLAMPQFPCCKVGTKVSLNGCQGADFVTFWC